MRLGYIILALSVVILCCQADSAPATVPYDGQVNAESVEAILGKGAVGWTASFSDNFYAYCQPKFPIVVVLGMFNKGKTWFANQLFATNLPTGDNLATRGIAVACSANDYGLTLVDTAGTDRPYKGDTHRAETLASSAFLRQCVLQLADSVIMVVNHITAFEQDYLRDIIKARESSTTRKFKLFVVHNFRKVTTQPELDILVSQFIVEAFNATFIRRNARGSGKYEFYESLVHGATVTHVVTAELGSDVGKKYNEQSVDWVYRSILTTDVDRNVSPAPFLDRLQKEAGDVLERMLFGQKLAMHEKGIKFELESSPLQDTSQCTGDLPKTSVKDCYKLAVKDKTTIDTYLRYNATYLTFNSASQLVMSNSGTFVPKVDILDTKSYLYLTLDVPGHSNLGQDIRCKVEKTSIEVSGTKTDPLPTKFDLERGVKDMTLRQRALDGQWSWRRTTQNPFDAVSGHCDLKNGVLTIFAPYFAANTNSNLDGAAGDDSASSARSEL